MPWVKIDDGWFDNTTNRAIGPKGRDLFLACLIYCTKGLTDGRIEKADLPMILRGAQTTRRLVEKLIEHGRVEDHGSHLEIPGYLDYQPSKAQVLADREREREKKRQQRAKGAKAVVNGSAGRFVPQGTTTAVPGGQEQGVPGGQEQGVPGGQEQGVPRYPSRPVPPTNSCTTALPGTPRPGTPTPGGARRTPDGTTILPGTGILTPYIPPDPITDDERAAGLAIARTAHTALHPEAPPQDDHDQEPTET